MSETRTEWYIVINPHAGSGKTMAEWAIAEERLAELGIPYETAFTGYKAHAKQLAYNAAAKGYRRMLAVGGDGSIHEIFTGVLTYCEIAGVDPEEFYFGVIPIGSGNDWIKTLGVPHDTLKVADIVQHGLFRREDVVRVKSSGDRVCYMANIGGIGFDSHVCERVNAKKERGRRSKRIYVNALIQTILHLKRFQAEVICDDETVYSGPCFSIALGNGPYSGGGMLQTAEAVIDDGLLDVLVIPVMSVFKIIKEVRRVFDGTTSSSPMMIYRKCKCLRIVPLNSKSEDIVEVDGEIEGNLPLEVTLSGHQTNVIKGSK